MTHDERLPQRIVAVARAFVLLALIAPTLWSQDAGALISLLGAGAAWMFITLLEVRRLASYAIIGITEGVLIGGGCGIAMSHSLAVLGALTMPPFAGAIYRGVWGVTMALASEVTSLVLVAYAFGHGMGPDEGYVAFSFIVMGLGLGFIGSFIRSMLGDRADPLAPYHYAQGLLRQLIDISSGLDNGLDPVTLGGGILGMVRDEVPTLASALYVPRGDELTPLVSKSQPGQHLAECDALAEAAWRSGMTELEANVFAVPLRNESGGTTAVIAAAIPAYGRLGAFDIEERLQRIAAQLEPSAVHLDTALLFAAFRDAATAEERRRLAREMHDGVAQDIASLGYLADAIAAGATSEAQLERIATLREQITRIVAEIRRSLVNLRTSVGASESLGAAIAAIARNLSEVSGVAIHVSVDEQTDRLRPEVEAELFRIAQEAMNNAVKHAECTEISVSCQVRAPAATISVSDNGRGYQGPRQGSHGMEIMRERARLINGELDLSTGPSGGLRVTVTINEDEPAMHEQITIQPPLPPATSQPDEKVDA